MKQLRTDILDFFLTLFSCITILVALIVMLSLVSCGSSKTVSSTSTEHLATLEKIVYRTDSLYIDKYIYVADTVRENSYIVIRLDTAGHETSREVTHDIYHGHSADNMLNIIQSKLDSSMVATSDTVRIIDTKVITKEQTLTLWQRLQIYVGRILAVILIIALIIYYIKKKFL